MIYGHQLLAIADAVIALGLAHSRQSFAMHFCERDRGYLRDYTRREGAVARVSPRTVMTVRTRLAEAAALRPDLAVDIGRIDAAIERDAYVARVLGRRSR